MEGYFDYTKILLENAWTKQEISQVIHLDGHKCLVDGDDKGYMGVAFQNAFYQLFHAKSFYDAVIDTLRIGGDTDTNACICGALCGAYFEVTAIPAEWIGSVKKFKNDSKRTEIYTALDHMAIYDKLVNAYHNLE